MLLKRLDESAAVSIDLTPMIDMVFLLLTFFLVATTFYQQEREMKIVLPAASSAVPVSAMLKELVVNVDERGGIILSGRAMDETTFREAVASAVRINPEQKVTVRGDRRAAYEHVVRVLDICKGAGIQEPYLDTVATP